MDLYTAKIRIGGSLLHEVIRDHLTPAELHVLAAIHDGANPCIVNMKKKATVNRSDAAERSRLVAYYGDGILNRVFGNERAALPTEIPQLSQEIKEAVEIDNENEVITPIEGADAEEAPAEEIVTIAEIDELQSELEKAVA